MKQSEVILLVCIISQMLGFVIFLKGFFPVKEAVQGYARWEDTQSNLTGELPPQKQFSRMVFVLIDALRADFVLPTAGSNLPKMEFLSSKILANETFSFIAKAHPPTVTLPRIKALTTGGIPGFIDVVLNFDSESLIEDNIITQLKRAGQRAVFYGDDTWIKLFPDHFIRTDGTTSFFVTDYTEVDRNVTRHLARELSDQPDWDVLILHYLGLDHIGHLAGPKSSLVKPKLEEMDDIVKQIYQSVKEMDVSGGTRSVVFVCGDHGMSDQGSHGGSSPSETLTPFVFLSPHYENNQGQAFQNDKAIYQIDLAPTLSLLLGLPVPQNSLGTLILDLFSNLEPKERLQMSHINARQIVKVFKKNTPQYERDSSYFTYQRALQQHDNWLQLFYSTNLNTQQRDYQLEDLSGKVLALYEDAMTGMRSTIASSLAEYDLHAMGVGIGVIWMVLLLQFRLYFSVQSESLSHHLFSFSSVTVAVLAEAVYLGVHATLCTSVYKSSFLCTQSSHTWVLNLVPALVLWVFVLVSWNFLWKRNCGTMQYGKDLNRMELSTNKINVLPTLLLVGTVGHSLSMLSSSFIEEEHQTWYFLTVTFHVVICFINIKNYILTDDYQREAKNTTPQEQTDRHSNNCDKGSSELQNLHSNNSNDTHGERFRGKDGSAIKDDAVHRHDSGDDFIIARSTDQSLCQLQREDRSKALAQTTDRRLSQLVTRDRGEHLRAVVCCVGVLVLCRVCRTWNRTGDKWAHLPDVGDWLTSPENKTALSVVSAFSLFILATVVKKRFNFINWLLFSAGSVCVYMFRAATGDLLCPGLYDPHAKSKGVSEARYLYVVILLILLQGLYELKQKISSIKVFEKDIKSRPLISELFTVFFNHIQLGFLLLMLLLVRPHNISLVAMEYLQVVLVHEISLYMNLSVLCTSLLYVWMGQAAFFYQGNSNSITTVDVSAGYIGIESYNPTIIGILLAFATYAGPLVWGISLISTLGQQMDKESITNLEQDAKKVNTRFLSHLSESVLTMSLTRTLPMSLYVTLVTLQRFHLFVWTVFSPKLLYEGMHALVLGISHILLLLTKNLCA